MAKKTMTPEKLEEHQANIDDVRKLLNSAIDSLDNAESCETAEDFLANVEAALGDMDSAWDDLKAMQK
jgi:hypothetical protein